MKLVLVLFLFLATAYFFVYQGGITNTFQGISPSGTVRNLLLPDLTVTRPKELLIRNVGGKKTLRFSTTFVNQGEGALEVIGHSDKDKKITYATQYISEADGPGLYQDVGSFVFHPEHNHWHINDYVFYQLLIKGGDSRALASTDKMSFCIWDEDRQNLDLKEAAPARVYTSSCGRQIQGMSVGWSDTYLARVEGQEMDITDIPDGIYVFRSIVNPERKISESDYDNNVHDIEIEIVRNKLNMK